MYTNIVFVMNVDLKHNIPRTLLFYYANESNSNYVHLRIFDKLNRKNKHNVVKVRLIWNLWKTTNFVHVHLEQIVKKGIYNNPVPVQTPTRVGRESISPSLTRQRTFVYIGGYRAKNIK